jgi:putative tryptophan/tyrosine transport system substrate-binding protein
MKRRDLVVGLSAVGILAGAVPGRAQRTRRVGYLSPEPPGAAAGQTEAALRQGLRDLGWIDGQNLTIIIRQAETPERMAAAAAELARLDVDLIVSAGSVATAAAKAATSRIPIVFGSAPDPVRRGFVESLARPGGNLTGLAILDEIVPKLLEIVREIVPQARRAAYLFEPAITPEPLRSQLTTERESAARLLGMDYQELPIRAADDIPGAITRAAFDGVDNLLLETSGLLLTQRHVVAALAAEQRIPAVGRDRNFVPAGALLSYGESLPDLYRRAAVYVDKVLKGAKPSDLPVEQPVRFELVLNIRTARRLGLAVPPAILARADEVIE